MKIYKERHITYGFADGSDRLINKYGKDVGKTYIGPTCLHMGRYYGTDVMSAHAEKHYELRKSDGGDDSIATILFEELKPQFKKRFLYPTEHVHTLTKKEIKKGEYSRYFVSQLDQIFEVDKNMWKYYSAKKTIYHQAVTSVEVKMSLSVFAIDKNKGEINKAAKIMPDVMLKIFPHDNMEIAENLETDGDDLQWDNGSEYIGPYHVHPHHGPMAGRRHTSKSHSYLYWQTKERYRPEGLV